MKTMDGARGDNSLVRPLRIISAILVVALLYFAKDVLRPAAMANLLGDLWENGEPDWAAACGFADVKLHLYGKASARPGRKMGHLTALADTPEEAARLVVAARDALQGK